MMLSIKALEGCFVFGAYINADHTRLVLYLSGGYCEITHPGSCCEHVFFQHANQVECLKKVPISQVLIPEWQNVDDPSVKPVSRSNNDCISTLGVQFISKKGHCTIETRLESNGCYGGDLSLWTLNHQLVEHDYDADTLVVYHLNSNGKKLSRSPGEKFVALTDF